MPPTPVQPPMGMQRPMAVDCKCLAMTGKECVCEEEFPYTPKTGASGGVTGSEDQFSSLNSSNSCP